MSTLRSEYVVLAALAAFLLSILGSATPFAMSGGLRPQTAFAVVQDVPPVASAPIRKSIYSPPPEYFLGGTFTVTFLRMDESIDLVCRQRGVVTTPAIEIIGCADARIWSSNPCHYPNEFFATTLCHEVAHKNGWRHPAYL